MTAATVAGTRAGTCDARDAWVGLTWRRSNRVLPVGHAERQEFLAAYASAFAAYNRSMVVTFGEGGE